MKAAMIAGFLAAWAGAGCMLGKGLVPGPGTPQAPNAIDKHWEKTVQSKPAFQPVTADQITEGNTRQIVDALKSELDRETLDPEKP